MKLISDLHSKFVYSRRIEVLLNQICKLIPPDATVLDVGCGDGMLDKLIMERRKDVTISGIDVLLRPETHIEVKVFDGENIPYDGNSFDVVMFIDVIHHSSSQKKLLTEARRVSKQHLLIKDHTNNGFMSFSTLKFMDWVGNRAHGVALPYNYWSKKEWTGMIEKLALNIQYWDKNLKLYPPPASWLFDRSLHFISMLSK